MTNIFLTNLTNLKSLQLPHKIGAVLKFIKGKSPQPSFCKLPNKILPIRFKHYRTTKRFRKFLYNNTNLRPVSSIRGVPATLELQNYLKCNNFLKTVNTKHLRSSYGFIYIKSSGINNFFTITNATGNVFILCLLGF